MKFTQSIKESWAELKPIKHKMTAAEIEWFNLFLQAYYYRNAEALSKIAPTPEAYENTRAEAVWMSNEGRRLKPNNARAYGSDYTYDSWLPNNAGTFSLEDAVIEVIDIQRSRENAKKTETVDENQTRSARSKKTKRGSNNKEERSYRSSRQGGAHSLARANGV